MALHCKPFFFVSLFYYMGRMLCVNRVYRELAFQADKYTIVVESEVFLGGALSLCTSGEFNE